MPSPKTSSALAPVPRATLGDRLDFLQRVAQVGLWEMRVRDRRLFVSDELRALFGICADAADPDFATLFARVHPDDQHTVEAEVANALRYGTPLDLEHRVVWPDGEVRHVHARGDLMHGRDGEPAYYGTVQDVTERRTAEQANAHLARRLCATLESITDVFYTVDREWRFTYLNGQAEQLFQRPRAELLGKVLWDEFAKLGAGLAWEELRRAMRERCTVAFDDVHASPQLYCEVRAYPSDTGLAVYMRDITLQKLTEDALRRSEERFRIVARVTSDAIWDLDLRTDTLWFGANLHELFGYTPDEFSASLALWMNRIHPDDRERVIARFNHALRDNGDVHWHDDYRFIRKNGSVAHVHDRAQILRDGDGKALRVVGAVVDVSERHAFDARIRYLAFHDTLTHLPNRAFLTECLEAALAATRRDPRRKALLLIDLDNFKTLNETLGHALGDQLLQQMAIRLAAGLPTDVIAARFGGDEFGVLLEHLPADKEQACAHAKHEAERINHLLSQPVQLDGYWLQLGASIGITVFSDEASDAGELLRRADLAMYRAKAAGRGTVRFFDPALQAAATTRLALEGDLRAGLRENAFFLHYQPQVERDGRIAGVEALVRWRHPERGTVSPVEFIPLAEETGLALPLGHWVLECACRQLSAWAGQAETAHLEVSVNVSVRQLHHPAFVAQVLGCLDQSGADPRKLKLEITEGSLLDDVEDAIGKIKALRAHGLTFAIDDFGTGYSSLAYLKRLPLDMLKIDRSFVLDLTTNPNDAVIARTIIALGASLGLKVLAEGVETAAQRDFLFANGCQAYQGYLCARPLTAEALAGMLRNV
ncbi:EAL domain-containing protein [Massilia sp. CFBP9012]|uniref:sensor domain-containing protein n=1 Tax=Massilia sp. CFBP9012 TaxID=3096531 RepID=UPI002A6A8F4E|nr:EAL domain-containing protein [Massilia sp. CFBP9012]MDY0976535.1 EAL domain-containing protein [Massilia sp. CFBP9012]